MVKISVIIPCYNQGKFIDDAVDSILNQTFGGEVEILIINDGSTDEFTNNLLCKYNRKNCRVIKTGNRGLAAARNEGLKLAKGEYIQFLDADDILNERKFETQLLQLEKSPEFSLCYCDYFSSGEYNLKEEVPSRYISPVFNTDNYLQELIRNWERSISIPCHSFLFKSQLFKNPNILFDESLPNHEDWDCWMRIFALKPSVYYINEKLITYRIRSNAMSNDTGAMNKGFLQAIEKRKNIFTPDSVEYKLLKTRQNEILFGYASERLFASMIIGSFARTKIALKRLLLIPYRSMNKILHFF